jgi:DivIVA domain-containing protein
VALDRQSIEKKDFPIARRGYDPEAVDAHLERLSTEVERLQREAASAASGAPSSAPAPVSSPSSIAVAASESVRAIVEAAESSAAGIEATARDEAERIRREAEADARSTRDEAVAKNQEQVGAVGEATSLMLQRVDAMEGEIGALIESLRTGANRLGADLSLLQGNMGELYDASGAAREARAPKTIESMPLSPRRAEPTTVAAEPDAEAPEVPQRSLPPIPEEAPDPSPHVEAPVVPPGLFQATDGVPAEPNADPIAAAAPLHTSEPAAGGGAEVDVDGARLIALNMALNGASRDETEAYLRDNFDLPDRAALVDEAFTTVEG